MMIRVTSYVAVFLAAIWLVGFPPALRANVNLEWRPAEQTVLKGDTVEISLYAVSDDPIADQPFSIIEAILLWEPSHLELLGKEDNGPYDWLASSFPDDSGSAFDGLNYPFTGLPSNDGHARRIAGDDLSV